MSDPNRLNLDNLHFEVYSDHSAQDFIYDNGLRMRELADTAYRDSIEAATGDAGRANAIAGELTHWDKPLAFANALADPQTAVESGKLNPGLFANTRLIVAYSQGISLAGYLVSHDNTSGRLAEAKMLTPPSAKVPVVGGKRYAWQQLEVVQWGARRQGVAEAMGYLSLAERHPEQPATAYTWPELLPSFARRLESVGFTRTHTQEKAGPENADLVRYAAPVKVVMDGIRKRLPGLEDALAVTRIERYPGS